MNYNSVKIAIIGLGVEGLATVRYFSTNYPNTKIYIFDEADNTDFLKNNTANAEYFFGDDCLKKLLDFDIIFVSPGVSIYKKELVMAEKTGAKIVPTTQLWFDHHRHDFGIFVTGTKGKSTTASLIFYVLNQVKKNVHLIGNIGKAAVDSITKTTDNIWVIEVSSFQAAKLQVAPDIAILTNLYPEHLDWHGSCDKYFADKLQIFHQSKLCIINHKFKNEVRQIINSEVVYFNHQPTFHHQNNTIYQGDKKIASGAEIPLKGTHNLDNIVAMLAAVTSMGVEAKSAIKLLQGFKKMPHRLEEFAKINDILYVDDCLSTIPQSTQNAINCYPHQQTTLIIGGMDRGLGDEWSKFANYLASTKLSAIIGLPDTGSTIIKKLQAQNSTTKLYNAKTLKAALQIAQKITPKGGTILLSPASPSQNQYKNYQQKGTEFQQLALKTRPADRKQQHKSDVG